MSNHGFINQLDKMGVEKAVIFNLDEESASGLKGLPNDYYADSVLQNQVMFGSTWLFMGQSIRQLADGVFELPLKESVKEKWLYINAKRFFEI